MKPYMLLDLLYSNLVSWADCCVGTVRQIVFTMAHVTSKSCKHVLDIFEFNFRVNGFLVALV